MQADSTSSSKDLKTSAHTERRISTEVEPKSIDYDGIQSDDDRKLEDKNAQSIDGDDQSGPTSPELNSDKD